MLIKSSLDIFDEYTRRQYLAKAPERNPFGEEEEAFKFSEFDIFAKLKVLHQLSVWTLNNPDRIKERMEDRDETNWVCHYVVEKCETKADTIVNSVSNRLAGTVKDVPTSSWMTIAFTV